MVTGLIKARKSFVLIPMILLILFVSISVLGLCFFILETSQKISADKSSLQSFYFAESGIQSALYWYRQQEYFSLGETVVNPGRYVLSADELGLLLVDSRNSQVTTAGSKVFLCSKIFLDNVTDSNSITVAIVVVSWAGTDPETTLTQVSIGGYIWSGSSFSPAACPISAIIDWNDDPECSLRFSRPKNGALADSITMTFFMSDGTNTGSLGVYPPSVGKMTFTFTSQGIRDVAGGEVASSIEAEYNALTGQIISYNKL